jgi:hypothetical protein
MDRLFGWGVKRLTTRIHYDQKTSRSSAAYGNKKIYRTVRESATMQNVYMIDKEHAHLMAKQAVGHQI